MCDRYDNIIEQSTCSLTFEPLPRSQSFVLPQGTFVLAFGITNIMLILLAKKNDQMRLKTDRKHPRKKMTAKKSILKKLRN